MNTSFKYESFGLTRIVLYYNESNNELNIAYTAEGADGFGTIVPTGNYKYFKLFAWADKKEFEIENVILDTVQTDDGVDTLIIDNISFSKLDLFQEEALSKSDAIVLPVSTNGTTQPNIRRFPHLKNEKLALFKFYLQKKARQDIGFGLIQ